ncbi:MAG: hypothetical protein AAGI53_13150 [Planctomycetota bacterium]
MPVLVCGLVLAICAAVAPGGPLFEIRGASPTRVVVTTGPDLPESDPPDAPMLRALLGIRAVYTTARDLRVTKAALGRPFDRDLPSVRTLAYFHLILSGEPDAPVRTLAILESPSGDRFARDIITDDTARMNDGALRTLRKTWQRAAAAPTATPDHRPGRVFDLPQPYTPSPISLTPRVMTDRFFRGRSYPDNWDQMDRTLTDETFSVRLPAGFDPLRPSGLLVWQSPTPKGAIPRTLHAAADALNLICIGAHNAGNYRNSPERGDPADRFQLVLDAIETSQRLWWIDHERVYITGVSGGGRISSMMWACFPDIIKGAVAIVGLNSPHTIPIRPGFVSPPNYMRPALKFRKMTKIQRLAGITGTEDFNEPEMVLRVEEHQDDGMAVRLWNLEGMGHTFPPDETFLEAMQWVDAPVRERREERLEQAASLLGSYLEAKGELPPAGSSEREQLVEVTRLAPWTEPAWKAAELLGIVEPSQIP